MAKTRRFHALIKNQGRRCLSSQGLIRQNRGRKDGEVPCEKLAFDAGSGFVRPCCIVYPSCSFSYRMKKKSQLLYVCGVEAVKCLLKMGADDVPRATAANRSNRAGPTPASSNNAVLHQHSMDTVTIRANNHLRLYLGKRLLSSRICTRTLAMMASPARPRRFAPLDPEKKKDGDRRPVLKGIVFDVDGTLCLPQNYMFGEMRYVYSYT